MWVPTLVDIEGGPILANCTKNILQVQAGLLPLRSYHACILCAPSNYRRWRPTPLWPCLLSTRNVYHNTRLCAMPTDGETRRSILLLQCSHDRPCRERNVNAFQTHAIIKNLKLDPKSELVHLKVDGDMTDEDLVMEVLRTWTGSRSCDTRCARAPPAGPPPSLPLPLARSDVVSRSLRPLWTSIQRAARCLCLAKRQRSQVRRRVPVGGSVPWSTHVGFETAEE